MRLSEIREFLGTGRDGATALGLAKAGRHYGLEVKAYTVNVLADLQQIQYPTIAHWRFNHFVVVERWNSASVSLMDPSIGYREVELEEFDRSFTGVILTFQPGPTFQSHHHAHRPMKQYFKYLSFPPGLLAQIIITSLILQLVLLVLPILTGTIIDEVIPRHAVEAMPLIGLGIGMVVLFQAITQYLRATLLMHLQNQVDAQMMLDLLQHLLALPYPFFQRRTSGDLLTRVNNISTIRDLLVNNTLSIILDGLFAVVSIVLLFIYAPLFGLLGLCLGLLNILPLMLTFRPVSQLADSGLIAQAEAQNYLIETLTGIATLKAAGAEELSFNHWSNLLYKQLYISLRRGYISATASAVSAALNSLAPLILLWIGTQQVLDGKLSVGSMLALSAMVSQFIRPLSTLIGTGQQLQLIGVYLDRLVDLNEAQPEQEFQAISPAPRLTGKIVFENVSYRHTKESPWVLSDISFEIYPGQKLAIVGETGSGKSTLAMLILALYTPTTGQIFFDDINMQKVNYRTLRQQFGAVLQDYFLFTGSIRNNITLNNPAYSMAETIAAAKLGGIHSEIMQMPMGYETYVTEEGKNLSGGQRQRLCIARALVHNPAILVFDEATSHLDEATENLIEESIHQLSCTQIIIAHRLSTIYEADQILVLHHGAIVERGTHNELLTLGGHYVNLFQNQLQYVGKL